MYGMGVAVGDYDNDGRDDVYMTALEGDRLFRNEGDFKFRDVTKASGIVNANFGTSAAWVDYDKDGRIDIFVANYVQWSEKEDLYCTLDGSTKSYCTPESYKGTASKLFRNLGGGKFQDVSAEGRRRGSDQQVARHRHPRLRRRQLARPLRGERHAAEQALSQQPERHVQRGRGVRGRRLQRGRRRARRDGGRTSATTIAPAARTCSSATSRTRCSRSTTTRARSSSSTPRRPPRWVARACCSSRSACSSSTTTSTDTSTSSRPTATSRRRSGACSRRCSTSSRR